MNHFKLRKCPLLYMGDQIHFCNLEIKYDLLTDLNFYLVI